MKIQTKSEHALVLFCDITETFMSHVLCVQTLVASTNSPHRTGVEMQVTLMIPIFRGSSCHSAFIF